MSGPRLVRYALWGLVAIAAIVLGLLKNEKWRCGESARNGDLRTSRGLGMETSEPVEVCPWRVFLLRHSKGFLEGSCMPLPRLYYLQTSTPILKHCSLIELDCPKLRCCASNLCSDRAIWVDRP